VFPHVFDPKELNSEHAIRTPALRRSSAAAVDVRFASVPLFAACSKKELRLIAKTAVVEARAPGATLVSEGDPGTRAFILIQGTCRVVRNGRKVGTVGEGGVVGELSLLTGAPRNATVVADTPLEVAILDQRDFLALLESSPSICRKMLQALATRVQQHEKSAT
jgi:CRP/FNR family transcriptional regulator, cyclic AMP receptor protein